MDRDGFLLGFVLLFDDQSSSLVYPGIETRPWSPRLDRSLDWSRNGFVTRIPHTAYPTCLYDHHRRSVGRRRREKTKQVLANSHVSLCFPVIDSSEPIYLWPISKPKLAID